ncbi:hypothetical protein H6P81_007526 [Aristolochia fimbriata]|uniref:Symplekin n=1 Tax=Aristolochia fimbriata TaxID=158543 RepID=A0AAV7F4B8_ARIFI|nr:hypothetical protein H6P81_007526 [Aristolochia fimbriata]
MSGAYREQAVSLLAAAKNHGDLAVKISSLKQAREILNSVEPSVAAEFFPYVVDLQSSSEGLVRKCLVELMEELTLKTLEHSHIFMPVLLQLLKDDVPEVVKQAIASGTNCLYSILEELALQFCRSNSVEKWLEELWLWMGRFKDAVTGVAIEPGTVGTKLLAFKFLEIYAVLLTPDAMDPEAPLREGKGQKFNISYIVGRHPLLDSAKLAIEANKTLGQLLDLLHSASALRGTLVIAVINCLASIARKRPFHYGTVLSTLLEFDPNFEVQRGGHTASIQYSLRTAFLGFLRCTHPAMMESRERLIRVLRAMNAGDAADQVIRQVDKMLKNTDRASRDTRFFKEELSSGQAPVPGEIGRKKTMLSETEVFDNTDEMPSKRARYTLQDDVSVNGVSSKAPLPQNDLTPAEQMIMMIGALLAEGERGFQSLEILISTIQPDLMADIVIANMKHLPRSPPPFSARPGNFAVPSQSGSQAVAPPAIAQTVPLQPPGPISSGAVSSLTSTGMNTSTSDLASNASAELKRDPRRDPRRFDPRRVVAPLGVQMGSIKSEDAGDLLFGSDGPYDSNGGPSVSVGIKVEKLTDLEVPQSPVPQAESPSSAENLESYENLKEAESSIDVPTADRPLSSVRDFDQDEGASSVSSDGTRADGMDASTPESDHYSSPTSGNSVFEEISQDLPPIPAYVELAEDDQRSSIKSAVRRIVEAYKEIQTAGSFDMRQALLARLVKQNGTDDDVVELLQKHIILDYQQRKGHELAMEVLYHLYSLMISESDKHAAVLYEKFLLAVATSLRDSLPASDKSFSRLLGEVPLLPDSALKLIEDLCRSDSYDKDVREGDRVTQGLGAVWSLILGRPTIRQSCLDIALKCSIHSQDDVRAKAIRLVANKLYFLAYASQDIEQFATDMLLSVVESQTSDQEPRSEGNIGSEETSVSGSQNSDARAPEGDSIKEVRPSSQTNSNVSLSQAQRRMSLFFALCTKKPSLLKLVFNMYGRAPKTVKQAINRHIPVLVRTLGSSYNELLHIISDPPQGSENLLMLVLQTLTEETTPAADLVSTVKHLYETKLKDAAILIPMLSSLSKDEVLPIFPRLVGLPLEKFQAALARILQGSAHTGPALTPAEVLVAIHDINPEKDGIPLKKITDACSACFEQRTVFTQQVLAKSLNQLVDQSPLPLLFMRTVIQAVDAFPALVDFVMEILSKLVTKQIWRMPKLWVGFLKCAAQTAPHSFSVLLQLPPPQLESALSRHANLRVSLAAYADQPNVKASLPRSTLACLGLLNDSHQPRQYMTTGLHTSETSSSVQGTTLT